jgi:hypothetical protein
MDQVRYTSNADCAGFAASLTLPKTATTERYQINSVADTHVLAAQARSGDQGLMALLSTAAARGWFAAVKSRVVIQVAGPRDATLAVQTAGAIAAFLQTCCRPSSIEIVHPHRRDIGSQIVRIAAPSVGEGLHIPKAWLRSFFLVTVAAVERQKWGRIAAVLEAQADCLRRAGNPLANDVLIFEAHRLAASDLSVACGYRSPAELETHRWWALGTSDIAVDWTIAKAAGLDPFKLPAVRTLARHEPIPHEIRLLGDLPSLQAYVAPLWLSWLAVLGVSATKAWDWCRADIARSRKHLNKIPRAVRQRALNLWRGRS